MEMFRKIATIIGVAVIGYLSFYIYEALHVFADMLLGYKKQDGMAILTAIIAVAIYLWKTHKQQGRRLAVHLRDF